MIKSKVKGWKSPWESSQARYLLEDLGNGITLDMIYIPGGKFLMGTEEKEIERLVEKFNWNGFTREKLQHEVISFPFKIATDD